MPSRSTMSTPDLVLIFGPQILSFDQSTASRLHTILAEPAYAWIHDVVECLPNDWRAATNQVSCLKLAQTETALETWKEWSQTGSFSGSFPLPNAVLTPLVVISHLIQYSQCMERIQLGRLGSVQSFGLCTGLLSAVVASRARTQEDLKRYGHVAIRLAMLVGAAVDAHEANGTSRTFSVAWDGNAEGRIMEILSANPQAYISVQLDERRATVTSDSPNVEALQQSLRADGCSIQDVQLHGRFHYDGHRSKFDQLLKFCNNNIDYQLGDARELSFPMRSNIGGAYVTGPLHEHLLYSMLVARSDWHSGFAKIHSSVDDALIVLFGPERSVPASLARKSGVEFTQLVKLDLMQTGFSELIARFEHNVRYNEALASTGIAVVGMSCHFPGAQDINQFWDILCRGESQHREVPNDRFTFDTVWRQDDGKQKWYGNFIDNHDTFDHKFFKKSPREMSSTDPQHRLMLQTSYHAIEQSGYFRKVHTARDKHIGCYIGVGLGDYERNIACAPANAYSATGNLKSFTAGKISHYFGWTGPGLTIDTACSSSAVAIHSACRSILSGECSAALAGGVNMMSSPEWFQNLAGASFLSPSGQCKPFDAKADGYCRGEGAGAVFLKRFTDAVADGDQILGVIGASMVYQNENCTAITIPNAPSLSTLFGDAIERAGLEPRNISYVEAHGTGTPVGDPAEYESIRQVLGGPKRVDNLSLGSVKGLVGHLESASGIVAVIKTLLMIQHQKIPPQASHDVINPSISATSEDHIEISKSLQPWDSGFKAALINNYGASGSNACLVITQPLRKNASQRSSETPLPFWLRANDEHRLRDYVKELRRQLKPEISMHDLSFHLARHFNRELRQSLLLSCSTIPELEQSLAAFEQGTLSSTVQPEARPVILCFGGQISTWIGLDRDIHTEISIFRKHLDQCDAICQSFGLESLYPGIFQRSPIKDIASLQVMLFANQYACAKSWIDCGITINAVVGHSFGELTALCVAGVLTLEDSIKMIAARSRLIKERWGPDAGAMMAVEGDLGEVQRLVDQCNDAQSSVNIACYNGKTTFTLAGPVEAINAAERIIKNFTLRSKRLNVTNAFHSILADPLLPELEKVGQSVQFHTPQVHIEHATETPLTSYTPQFIGNHLRKPVYFCHAITRLAQRHPDCIWLEAGSNSTVTTMINRCIGGANKERFQPVNISQDGSIRSLVGATMGLWQQGLDVMFWAHNDSQVADHDPVLLPPYQFERARHWIDWKAPPKMSAEAPALVVIETPKELWSYFGSNGERSVRFQIHPASARYQDMVSSHVIAQKAPLCPSTFQLQIVIEALMSIPPANGNNSLQPQLYDMTSHAPMSLDPTRSIWLDATATSSDLCAWDWEMTSNASNVATSTKHVTGRINFRSTSDGLVQSEFQRWERLVRFDRCRDLLNDNDPDEVMKSPKLYKRFAEIVEYGDKYHGVRKLVGKGENSAGRVVKNHNKLSWFDTSLGDSFCQVAGMYINMMTDRLESDVYISDKIERWIRSPTLVLTDDWPETWDIFATHHRPSAKKMVSDVFVFDASNGKLMEVIAGIHYQLVPKAALAKVLSKLSQPGNEVVGQPMQPVTDVASALNPKPMSAPVPAKTTVPEPTKEKKSDGPNVSGTIREIIVNLSGLEAEVIKDDSDLVELGIDSLMAMELGREIDLAFSCQLDTDRFVDLTDFRSLVVFVCRSLGLTADEADSESTSPGPNGTLTPDSTASDLPANLKNTSPEFASIPVDIKLEAFARTKQATDRFMVDQKLATYCDTILPKTTEMCVVHILDAFDQLGCSIRNARPGDKIQLIKHLPKHQQFVDWIYDLLETSARLIDSSAAGMVRTSISCPTKSAETLLGELNRDGPVHTYDYQLTYLVGVKLADCLAGKEEAIQLIFGSPEGREIATGMYGKSPINIAWIAQIEMLLTELITNLPANMGPIKILEMGAGTGGTSARLIPLLANLGVPIEYTVTDLSASLVAFARKRFKQYPFVKVCVFDIEQGAADLLHSQHLVLATNCVHATHNLVTSTKNIHKVLRPDGFLLMLEMTVPLPWVDLIFGLIEGWWLFDDGRKHALAPPEVWERSLHEAGYGHVDWSDGTYPETKIQRVIIAHAAPTRYERGPIVYASEPESTDFAAREAEIDAYVRKFTTSFVGPSSTLGPKVDTNIVLVTGATGSLGSELVAQLARLSSVYRVVCMNRPNTVEPRRRQLQAMASRGIALTELEMAKLQVIECDTSKPSLGLSTEMFEQLCDVTAIIQNAWPMSISRGLKGFAAQFQVTRNLIDLAQRAASRRPKEFRFTFQFISSIATVGMHPLISGQALVPETRMHAESVLGNGYGDAKLVCEHMLDATLHKYPERFRVMAVRIGQITGSITQAFWNPVEHFSFLVKSSQTLKVLPDLQGDLSWCPVDTVAATLSDLVVSDTTTYPVYHIENPARQSWPHMIHVLAASLNIPTSGIVPFAEWINRVKQFPGSDTDNPAGKLAMFLEQHFVRMSCGGLILDTVKTQAHSSSLRKSRPISDELVRRYIGAWKASGFLH